MKWQLSQLYRERIVNLCYKYTIFYLLIFLFSSSFAMSFHISLNFISHSVRYFMHITPSSVSFLSHHSYTSMVIVSHPFCKKLGSSSSRVSRSIPPTYPSCEHLSSFYQQSITIVWELQVFVAYIRNGVRASEAFVESRRNCGYSWDSIRYKKENEKRERMSYSPALGSDISYFCNNESTNIFWLFDNYKLFFIELIDAIKSILFNVLNLCVKKYVMF